MINNKSDLQIYRIKLALKLLYDISITTPNQLIQTKTISKEMHDVEIIDYQPEDCPTFNSYKSKIIYRILKDLIDQNLLEKIEKNGWQLTTKGMSIGKFLFNEKVLENEFRKKYPIMQYLEDEKSIDLSIPLEGYFNLNLIIPDNKNQFTEKYDILRAQPYEIYKNTIAYGLLLFFGIIDGSLTTFGERFNFQMLDVVAETTKEEILESFLDNPAIKNELRKAISQNIFEEMIEVCCHNCKPNLSNVYNQYKSKLN